MAAQVQQPKIAQEMAQSVCEPFEPVERKLVTWSLVLGAILLVLLVWVSYAFFTA